MNFKEIHEYIVDYGDTPYKYISDLYAVPEKDKNYICALYLTHQAYKKEAERLQSKTSLNRSQVLLDSSLIYLEKTRGFLTRKEFSKQLDYFAPLVGNYGIYDSEEQLYNDFVDIILTSEREILIKRNTIVKVQDAFDTFSKSYDNLLASYSELLLNYPLKNDLLVLSDQEYEEVISNFKNILLETENTLNRYQSILATENDGVNVDFKRKPVDTYDFIVSEKQIELLKEGVYFDFNNWLALIENARLNKIGDFWDELATAHSLLQRNLFVLSKGKVPTENIELDSRIIDKIKYIDAESALIPYLLYLGAKNDLLKTQLKESNFNSVEKFYVDLHQFLQQCKFNLQLLESRLKSGKNEKNQLFFQNLAKNKDGLLLFISNEGGFLLEKEVEVSNSLKSLLVNDFLSNRFKPSFVSYQSLNLATYIQSLNTVQNQGKSLTTAVKTESGAQIIGGSLLNTKVVPFVSVVEGNSVKSFAQNFITQNDFNEPFDYFHCSATFKSNNGFGAVFYPEKLEKSTFEKQQGLLLFFNNSGQLQKKIQLPYSRKISNVLTADNGSGYVLMSENEYLAASYFKSELMFINTLGTVVWKKVLPFTTFDSNIKFSDNGILVFANAIQKVPGNDHIKSEVKVLSFNKEGGLVLEKDIPTTSSRFASKIQKDQSGKWLILGFIGNNDLYNLREKDVFFYMLDHSFDDLGGGELTSVERP
ncbi:hypothetical protein [Chondrinema litorale]|uniref:hypothetical protein n=1 Tax=Chondrinema litorale TaxID=2994555 RepID=UPI0025427E46|nr:hypothetical protein [Chondrinema litorale]UZR93779.1 hypothetical protein OQ292_18180 [Chondrinema litorale]